MHQTLVKYYYKLVILNKIIQQWVSIYETNERDIGARNIHKYSAGGRVVNGTPGIGASQLGIRA